MPLIVGAVIVVIAVVIIPRMRILGVGNHYSVIGTGGHQLLGAQPSAIEPKNPGHPRLWSRL
jgi:hypothetical protein